MVDHVIEAGGAPAPRFLSTRPMLYVSPLVELLRARPSLLFWIAAISQATIWILVPALFYAAPPGDVPRLLAIGHNGAFAGSFGPPLAYWLGEIAFDLAGHRALGVYILSQICVVGTFWAVFALGRSIVGARHAVMAVLLMVGITAFSIPTPEFGPGLLAAPLTALAVLHAWKAIGKDRHHYWYLLAVELGLLMATSEAALIMISLLALFLVVHPHGRAALERPEPWLAGLAIALILIPHLLWLERLGAVSPRASIGLSRLLHADDHLADWLTLIGWLLAIHAAMIVMVVAAGGVNIGRRAAAPAFEREPVMPEAQVFVYYFTLAPAFVATIIAVLLGRNTPLGGAPALAVLSGLAVIVVAGDVIELHRQRAVSFAWLGLLIAPPVAVVASLLVLPWTLASDLAVNQPAAVMAQFFSDTFHRRTGKPLEIVGGEQRLAEIVALASSDRPVVFFEGPPDLTPWVSDADVKAKGAVFIWHAVDNVGTPPASLLSRFPDLVPEVPRSFQRAIEGRLPLLRIGWAVIRPALAQ